MNTPFFNIFRNTHFETPHFSFKCVFDSEALSSSEKRNLDIVTHLAESKGNARNIKGYISENVFGDYSLILSLIEGTHVFCDEYNWGRRNDWKKMDEKLLMSEEIEDFFKVVFGKLESMEEREKVIIRRALLLLYEAKHQMFYDDIGGILTVNCFEYLVGSIYRLRKGLDDLQEVKLWESYKFVVDLYDYDKYVMDVLHSELRGKDPNVFKEGKGFNSIKDFDEQLCKMRNWTSHGQQVGKPAFENSPSDNLWTFLRRLEVLIRIILIDMLYGEKYKRKFDALYQLILEQNVCTTFTPEFPKLRFRSK